MIYSFNFWTAFFVDLTVFLIQIAVFSVVFLQVDSINGWNSYQLIFFVGTFTVIDSLYMCTYFFGVIGIPDKIRTGKLDIYLTKPINTLFYVSFENMDFGSILLTLPGIGMLAYSAGHLKIAPGFVNIAGYILLVLLMTYLMYTLMILVRVGAFWFTRVDSFGELENELVNFSFRIPGVVFKGAAKLVFYILVPYGLIATVPTQFFTDILSGRSWLLVFIVCTGFGCLSTLMWKAGLKHYGSASS
jgi:ABC-2 type transport system permease protein